jgi:hypothetical protein
MPHAKQSLHDENVWVLGTIIPRCKIWDFRSQRLLTGVEVLRIQGFPDAAPSVSDIVSESRPRLLHDLAGNAMSGTIVLALSCSLLLSAPWKPMKHNQVAQTSSEDVQRALAVLAVSLQGGCSDSDSDA